MVFQLTFKVFLCTLNFTLQWYRGKLPPPCVARRQSEEKTPKRIVTHLVVRLGALFQKYRKDLARGPSFKLKW
jgi:hypothetical protein